MFQTINDQVAKKVMASIKGEFLIVYRASFSGPCAVYRSTVEEFAADKEYGIPVLMADLEDCMKLAKEHAVKAVPLTLYFDAEGKHVRSIKGMLTRSQLQEFTSRA